MSVIRAAFDERLDEVRAYLEFLKAMETQMQHGPPRFQGAATTITPQQQKLLYATVYLHLYNLVEATMTLCIGAVAEATSQGSQWTPGDLSDSVRKEWVRSEARTHVDLNYPNRLEATMQVVDRALTSAPVPAFDIEKGAGGNWDDRSIEKMSVRLGCILNVSTAVSTSVKRHVKDDLGPLALVKAMRNSLAHGHMSFTESADQVTVSQLTLLAESVIDYLSEVVDQFISYVDGHEYLLPARRPVTSA